MIVTVIIGILAAVSAPGFTRSIERAKVKDAEATLSTIYTAEKIYRLDQGTYGTLANLTSSTNNYVSDPNAAAGGDWTYSTAIPALPASTFTATATRNSGGFAQQQITINEVFDGSTYGGNHPLRDQ